MQEHGTENPSEIAQAAARLVVEDGLEYGPAKRQALQILGLPARTALPRNDEVEAAVREHIALFCPQTQAAELIALRRLAHQWMLNMQSFRPYLSGSVWHGTATRASDIYIQLFCDDEKSAEIALIDLGVRYEPGTVRGLHGDPVEVLSILQICDELGERVGVHLMIYDYDDLKGALNLDGQKRPPRGDLAAVSRMLQEVVHES